MIYSSSLYLLSVVLVLLRFFQHRRQTLGAFGYRVRQFVVRRDELEEPLQPLLKEAELHVLVPPPQKQVHFDAVAFLQPRGRLFGLQLHIVVAGANLDLDAFRLGSMGFGLHFPAFFLLFVLEFTIFHYFCNRRDGVGAYLDKVQPELLRLGNGVREGQDAEILPLGAEHAHLLGPYLMIDASSIQSIVGHTIARHGKNKSPTPHAVFRRGGVPWQYS